MRDVINRLDYDDVKTSMTHGRRCPNEAIMAHSPRKPKKGAVTPAPEVILPKIECILNELKAAEEKNSPRMRHIDHSLAELSAANAEVTASCGFPDDSAVAIHMPAMDNPGSAV